MDIKLPVASLIFLILFGVASIFHLVTCFIENETIRRFSKPFCLAFLTVAMILWTPMHPFIYIGPIMGLLGDFFLLFKHKLKYFVFGTIFFLLGHISYLTQIILFMVQSNVTPPPYVFVIFGVVLVLIAFLLLPFTKKLAGRAALLGNFYMPFVLIVGIFALILSTNLTTCAPIAIVVAFGFVLFLISDSFTIYSTFVKSKKRKHFYAMFPYLLAEFIITFGLAMIGMVEIWA